MCITCILKGLHSFLYLGAFMRLNLDFVNVYRVYSTVLRLYLVFILPGIHTRPKIYPVLINYQELN